MSNSKIIQKTENCIRFQYSCHVGLKICRFEKVDNDTMSQQAVKINNYHNDDDQDNHELMKGFIW